LTPNSSGPRKIIPAQRPTQSAGTSVAAPAEFEVLVVASKVKDYIRRRSEMNTAAEVLQTLSHHIRRLCDEAIDSARNDGRKTVMERDFKSE
jgi:histone H3/H4